MFEGLSEVVDYKVTATWNRFYNKGFNIFSCKGGFSVKGFYDGGKIASGDFIVTGTIDKYKGVPQINATSITAVSSSQLQTQCIADFLKDNFDGIGEKSAAKLADEYGESVLDAFLKDPIECSKIAPGISSSRAGEISGIIDEELDKYQVLLQLRIYQLSHSQSISVWNEYGKNSISTIKSNPYSLIRISGITYESCEKIANFLGFDLLSANRFECAIINFLAYMHSHDGNTYELASIVTDETKKTFLDRITNSVDDEVLSGIIDDAYDQAVSHKQIVVYKFIDGKCTSCNYEDKDARVALCRYFSSETTIKREIESFLKAKKVVPNKETAMKAIDDLALEMGYILEDTQKDAIYMSLYEPISIITGGPGTGKTTITGILSQYYKNKNISCVFCAPTGRAAKRLSEVAGVKAQTLHRLLEVQGETMQNGDADMVFRKGPDNPIDARVVIVDETSMVDTMLFKALLLAIKKDASLILIGDPDQLPSVGPGNVLSDLLTCEAVPRTCLQYVFRQEQESSIASNSCRVLKGEYPISNDVDFQVIDAIDDDHAMDIVREISAESGLDSDMVILCPTKQNSIGTVNLNSTLQTLFSGGVDNIIKAGSGLNLCIGDKVMQIKNNYQIEYFDPTENELTTGIYNGEIGIVKSIDFMDNSCEINFDDGRCVLYNKKQLEDIDLAYAMTVHKAQGCEFDTVIIVLGTMSKLLINRNLLYTAITRGKQKVIIINSQNKLQEMINSKDILIRKTSLKDFLHIVSGRYL